MAVYKVQGPDGQIHAFEGPDGASQDQVLAVAQKMFSGAPAPAVNQGVVDAMGTGDRLLSAIGGGMDKVGILARKAAADARQSLFGGTAAGDALNSLRTKLGLPSIDQSQQQANADLAEQKKITAPLNATTAGKVGNVIGTAAAVAPTVLIPGANTYVGAGLIGAGTGATLSEGNTLKDRAVDALKGAAGGVAGKAVGDVVGAGVKLAANKLAQMASQKAAQNALQQTAVQTAQDAGYVLPPTSANSSAVNNALEGLSGKIKTAQVASARNQEVTNNLAKDALGLPKDQPITVDALNGVRQQAGQAYDAVASSGTITPGQKYFDALNAITKDAKQAAAAFPDRSPSPLIQEIDGLKSPQFDASAAVAQIKELRGQADKAFASGDKALGSGLKNGAAALENAIEDHLSTMGQPGADLLQAFRDARQTIAKTYTVQNALNPVTGDINAAALGKALAKGKPLSGELATVGQVAAAFPKATQALKEAPGALSPLDYLAGAVGGHFSLPGLAAIAARPAVRNVLLSSPYQSTMLTPGAGLAMPAANGLNALMQYGGQQALPVIGNALANSHQK